MNRPQQVRAVFQELRQTVGHLYSARELLEKAAALVNLFLDEDDDHPLYSESMSTATTAISLTGRRLNNPHWPPDRFNRLEIAYE